MNVKARITCLSVAALAVLTADTVQTAQSGDYQYSTDGPAITITSYSGPGGAVAIPATIAGLPVTRIGAGAFYGHSGLTSVTIPKSITNIGDVAFSGCTGLISVVVDPLNPAYSSLEGVLFDKYQNTLIQCPAGKAGAYAIPDSVTSVRSLSFAYCTALTGVTIPDSVTGIDALTFRGCTGLTSVTLGSSLTGIGHEAFSGCAGLTSVAIPNSVTDIQWSAFSGCTALTNVTLGSSVTYIWPSAFSGCTALISIAVDPLNLDYSSLEGALFNKNRNALILCPTGKAGAYAIPDSVTSIGREAFYGCTELTSVIIPNSVTNIEHAAFSDCTGLTSAYFAGNAPSFSVSWGGRPYVFPGSPAVIVYYRTGTTGWGPAFAGRPAALWVTPPVYREWLPSSGLTTRYPDAAAETEDPDQDGMTNHAEMLAGTDPTDGSSCLTLELVPRLDDLTAADQEPIAPGQRAVYLRSVPAKSYGVQWAETLTGPWNTRAVVTATTTQTRFVHDQPPPGEVFYRLILAQ